MQPQHQPMLPSHMISALTRRGVNPQLLMQQSPMQTQETPASPIFSPGNMPPSNPPMPDRSPMSGINAGDVSPQPPTGSPMATPQKFAPKNEGELIVNALIKRLEHHSKMSSGQNLGDIQENHQRSEGLGLLADFDEASHRHDKPAEVRIEKQIVSMPSNSPYEKYRGMFAQMLSNGQQQ